MSAALKNIDSEFTNSKSKASFSLNGNDTSDNADSRLFLKVSSYLRAGLDIEDAENDPNLTVADRIAIDVIEQNRKKTVRSQEIANFVTKSLSPANTDTETSHDLQEIMEEISAKNIDSLTTEWVKEWHQKHQGAVQTQDKKSLEIRDFIARSLEPEVVTEPVEHKTDEFTDKSKNRSGIIRLSVLSAAAVISIFLVLRTLAGNQDTGELYSSFYNPYPAVFEVTRSNGLTTGEDYNKIARYYKNKEYGEAVKTYSGLALEIKGSDLYSEFFAGLSCIELKNFDQAIIWLSSVAESDGDLGKDASWYLGLAYLADGDKENAYKYFDHLSRSDGYYKERSEKLLRHLK